MKKFSDEIPVNIINKLKAKHGIPLKSRVLITVGRAAKEKNIDELIRYFKRLDMENTFFVIVGGGPYLETLKKLTFSENI